MTRNDGFLARLGRFQKKMVWCVTPSGRGHSLGRKPEKRGFPQFANSGRNDKMMILPQAVKPCPPELEEFSHSKGATLNRKPIYRAYCERVEAPYISWMAFFSLSVI